jgi:hypothetical protein
LFDIPHPISAERKDHMIETILSHEDYDEDQWREIEDGNRDDVLCENRLLEVLAPTVDLPAALFRARYLKPAAAMELCGLPVDVDCLHDLQTNWQPLRLHYIRQHDTFGLYDKNGSFHEDRFTALVEARGWIWPRTATGKPELKGLTLAKQCRRYPELIPLQRLRDQIAELRLGAFLNTIGADGFSRCPIMPFWTRSGRNQPQGRDKVFLPSLSSWTHGVIKPPPGHGLALLDWMTEEPGIAAGLSQDPALLADYQSGDLHMRFAIRAGLAPEGATKRSHGAIRDGVKPVSLGANYGISKYGVAAQTGRSLQWAADVLASHRHNYRVFAQWQHDTATQALFDERIMSPLGWPMAVHAGTNKRTLLNYPMQAGGADMLRLAAIAAHEAGIRICAPVHDAFWIMAPLGDLDDAIATMMAIMLRAGRVVAGIDIPVEVAAVVRWPQCFGDVRKPDAKGQAMWEEVKALLRGELQQARQA